MIYGIGIYGLLACRFELDAKPAAIHRVFDDKVRGARSVKTKGALVWSTVEEAQAAATWQNEKSMREHNRQFLALAQTWVVVGVSADWETDTDLQEFAPHYPNAKQLIRPAVLIELQQNLNL